MPKSKQEIYENTFNKVLNFLSYSSRTTKEVEDRIFRYLYKKDLSQEQKDEIKNQIMSDLDNLKLLNDRQYAQDYVRSKLEGKKPVSKRKLQEFLYKKGVTGDKAEEALTQLKPEDEEKYIEKLALKKLSTVKDTDPRIKKQKVANYLLSKGFNPGTVFEVLDKLLSI